LNFSRFVNYKPLLVILATAAGAFASGCGNQDDSTPVACLEGAATYERALEATPGDVRLEGETPISDCLAPNQTAGDLAQVGEALVVAATELNAEARTETGGDSAFRLGYLLGAARRGSEQSEGIHSDLVRRLTVAARYAPGGEPLPAAFYRAYRSGYAAGLSDG
jgi:hypothetical protein